MTRAWIVSELGLVSLAIMIPLAVHAGMLDRVFGDAEVVGTPVVLPTSSQASDIPLLSALQNPNPVGARGGAEIVVSDDALVSTGPVGEDVIEEASYSTGEIRVYTVRPGDTPSHIAEMFDISVNTLYWANDITDGVIQPGQTLVILPISGVQHVVASGESLSEIVDQYEADIDEVIEYNQLATADAISVGDELIIPGGAMHVSAPSQRYAPATPTRTTGGAAGGYFSHPVPGAVKTQGIHGYNAVDLAAGYGTPIRAAAAGEVIVSKASGWNGGYGRYIVLRHPNGTQTLYSHLSRNDVGVGAYVEQGQVIGGMGDSGRSTGTHLHFEVRGARNPF